MYRLDNKVAVVTGAGSGIGRALALQLAGKGCRLALSDIKADALAETAAMLPSPAYTQTVDVADRDAVFAFADAVKRECGGAHVIINNAGVALAQTIENMSFEDFEWLMNINFWGVVYGTKAFLPTLRAQDDGVIVNLSSIFGIIAVPTQGAYHSAKFAVRGFTETLRQELDGSGVSAVCVHPGGIRTNIARNARHYVDSLGNTDAEKAVAQFDKIARTTADEAARVIIDGIERRRPRVLIGADAKLLDRIQRWAPVNYPRILGALLKRLRDR
ncbi:MAG: SDR family NAD(P)-dependent oxidoreductase [Sinimarinibacterium flocculans]|uniref:SDR family NAD(P)-dependent oxidoreductase n=1 Tax=Sinimarinibacterium flocculans TaxID=985250 RepID=UPI003C47ED76